MLLSLLSLALAGAPAPTLHVGDPALLFNLPAVNEDAALKAVARTTVALSDFTGVSAGFPAKAAVVVFVDRAGGEGVLQALERLHRKVEPKGVRIVAVLAGPGDIASVSDWIEGQRLSFPVVRDAHGIVVSRYGVKQYPTTFVVDAQGDVAAIGVAKADLESGLETVLTGLVGK